MQRQRQQLQRFQLPLEILVSVPLPVLLGLAFPVPIRVQKIQVRALFFLLESGSARRWLLPSARPFCRKPLGGLAAPFFFFFFLVTRNVSLQPFFLPWALPREQGWVRTGLAHLHVLCERLSVPLKGRRGGLTVSALLSFPAGQVSEREQRLFRLQCLLQQQLRPEC